MIASHHDMLNSDCCFPEELPKLDYGSSTAKVSSTSPRSQACAPAHIVVPPLLSRVRAPCTPWKATVISRLDMDPKRAYRTPYLEGYDPVLEDNVRFDSYVRYSLLLCISM